MEDDTTIEKGRAIVTHDTSDREVDDSLDLHSTFVNTRKQTLYFRYWIPGKNSYTKAVIFLFHGLGEHIGRHVHVARYLNAHHYAVFGLDHHGHGQSQGEQAYLESFDHYIADTLQFMEHINTNVFPNANAMPQFILGHSLGGAIAICTAYQLQIQKRLPAGVVLSGPAISLGGDFSWLTILAARVLAKLLPHVGVDSLSPEHLSRDPSVVKAYVEDPLVYHGKVKAKLGAEVLQRFEWFAANMHNFDFPFIVLHGTEDKLTNPLGSKQLYEKAASEDKTIKLYEGLFHEIFNEPEKEQVLADVVEWLDKRLDKLRKGTVNNSSKKAGL